MFRDMEWDVVTLKYGRLLEQAFARRGGDALRDWIDACPNVDYSGARARGRRRAGASRLRRRSRRHVGHPGAPRRARRRRPAGADDEPRRARSRDRCSTRSTALQDDRPTCFIAYTIKGYRPAVPGPQGQPRRADERPSRSRCFKQKLNIARRRGVGAVCRPRHSRGRAVVVHRSRCRSRSRPSAGIAADARAGARRSSRSRRPARTLRRRKGSAACSPNIARDHPELADRIVTTSPDVTVSTNLGAWVNRRGVFGRGTARDVIRSWQRSPRRRNGRCRRQGSTSSSGSRRAICSSCWPRSACRGRSSARGCCRSARSTTRSSAVASMR